MEAKEIKLGDGLSRIEIHGLNEAGRICCLAFRTMPTDSAWKLLDNARAGIKATAWPYSSPNAVAARRKLARHILGV